MIHKFEQIILQKKREVLVLREFLKSNPLHDMHAILAGDVHQSERNIFENMLRANAFSIIAEIKRRSPSKGLLAPIEDPIPLVEKYILGGANAISVLTDEMFFGGTLSDLQKISMHIREPVLRKDFILDEIQIAEARFYGADAILAIVALLGDQTKFILNAAKRMQMDVIVEVHDHAELNIALESGARMIGVNNRDLKTFTVDKTRALDLFPFMGDDVITIAESGIQKPEDVHRYRNAGFHAVLIGEALVKHPDPAAFIRVCHDV